MQVPLENDRREIKRRHLIFHLRVFDRITNEKLGHIVDISPEGMMLVSEEPIPVDQNFQLRMHLPNHEDAIEPHDFEARSCWSNNDINPMFYDTGFHVIQATSEHIQLVKRLVDDYGFRD
ncbi:MAG: PilZ domain-containing protein [Pseudomonadota bacterium]